MQNSSTKMMLLAMPKKGFVATFVIVGILFILCIIIGAIGPQVYDWRQVSAYRCPEGITVFDPQQGCDGVDLAQPNTKWVGEIQHLDKLNQELVLRATLMNKDFENLGVEKEIQVRIDVAGRNSVEEEWEVLITNDNHHRKIICREGNKLCQNITVAHLLHIRFQFYQFQVSFEEPGEFLGDVYFTFLFVDHSYTLFELWFRFAFLIVTFIIVIVFAHRLRSSSWRDWTMEQKWIATLLFGLMAYNNPFYPLEILVNNWFPIFLNRLFYGTFLALLFLFWLIMFDGIRTDSTARSFVRFYLPKFILVGLFWVISVALFTWTELQLLSDPGYTVSTEFPGFIVLELLLLALLIFYIFWVVISVCRAYGDTRTKPYLGLRLRFFGIFTFITMVLAVGGITFGAIGRSNNAAEFLSFLALFNLYCYTLAFMYSPRRSYSNSSNSDKIGMVRLEEEEEEDADSESFRTTEKSKDDEDDDDELELDEMKSEK